MSDAPFNRHLSLAIDAAHDKLWHLQGEQGVWATLRRWWVTHRLHRLERGIPL